MQVSLRQLEIFKVACGVIHIPPWRDLAVKPSDDVTSVRLELAAGEREKELP